MSRWRHIIPAIAVALLLGACGDSGPDSPVSPTGPKLDGGYIVGGNVVPVDSTSNSSTGTSPDTTTNSGGYIVGGN